MKLSPSLRIESVLAASVIAIALAWIPGAWAAQIMVGQVVPMSGPEAEQARAYNEGMRLAFEGTNRAGGVNGHTFALTSLGNGGLAQDTARATRQLLTSNPQILVLAGYVGRQGLTALAGSGLIESERIALVGYRSTEVREAPGWLYNVRANLRDELNKITGHLGTLGASRLGLLYEDGPGKDALIATAKESAGRNRANIVAEAGYEAGTTRVADAVERFLQADLQAIIIVGTGAASARFIEQYRTGGGAAQIFVHSGADMEHTARLIAQDRLSFVSTVMRGVAIAQVVPNPYEVSPLSRELGDAVRKSARAGSASSYVLMEGFIAGKVIIEAVRRQGAKPTRLGMTTALESMSSLNLGGHVINYPHGDRQGSRFVQLTIISGTGKIRQ